MPSLCTYNLLLHVTVLTKRFPFSDNPSLFQEALSRTMYAPIDKTYPGTSHTAFAFPIRLRSLKDHILFLSDGSTRSSPCAKHPHRRYIYSCIMLMREYEALFMPYMIIYDMIRHLVCPKRTRNNQKEAPTTLPSLAKRTFAQPHFAPNGNSPPHTTICPTCPYVSLSLRKFQFLTYYNL